MTVPELGDPVTFYQRHFRDAWWTGVIQSYAQLKLALAGEGLHQHHLIPKSLFLHGPAKTRDLIDYVPSVPLTETEHLKTLHAALNETLRANELWQRDLSAAEVRRAIEVAAQFYDQHGLRHFAAAVRGFLKEAYDKTAVTPPSAREDSDNSFPDAPPGPVVICNPGVAGEDADNSFPDTPPGPVVICNPGVGGFLTWAFDGVKGLLTPKKESPKWTPAQIKKNLDDCDGGTGVWAAAKQANGGKDPVVKPGTTTTGGFVDTQKGEITLDENLDRCFATQIQIQELTNLSHKQDFQNASKQCQAGNLSRDEFIRAYERAEYDGVHKVIQAFDACKDKWGCKTCEKEWARQYKTFDEYFDKALSKDHKENYGRYWDSSCKTAYENKQTQPGP